MGARRRPDRSKQAREGSAAVEFALVAAPFFFMLFALLEVGLIFTLDSTLESAVMQTSRKVRTGEAARLGYTPAEFKTQMCDRMTIFAADCENRAYVDVREIVQFRTPEPPDPLSGGGTLNQGDMDYSNGAAASLMLVRVWYKHPVMTPMMQQMIARTTNGEAVLMAATTFRNEPF
ncbi:MAG: pilus assembly protein [Brevundimonas sp.]|uniref:TadE/TadG family type IV pilus assembly protein n=1 Tax=Brevundimonas sp. TaxID=1871086 RepID=UPI0011F91F98|nr:TadE family protein [Brevundimonas sp.]RZJ17674.1 MAG: pilus assembly protein [Brevundimonas sp.]